MITELLMESADEYKFSRKEQRCSAVITSHKICIILIFTLLCVLRGRVGRKKSPERDQDEFHTQPYLRISYFLFVSCANKRYFFWFCLFLWTLFSIACSRQIWRFSCYNRNAIKLHWMTMTAKTLLAVILLRILLSNYAAKICCNLRSSFQMIWH